mgnify:CR=1 FL=1
MVGYVGWKLLDEVSIGNVFALLSVRQMYEVTKVIDHKKGIALKLGNPLIMY